jgi:hypothetical protein
VSALLEKLASPSVHIKPCGLFLFDVEKFINLFLESSVFCGQLYLWVIDTFISLFTVDAIQM